MREFKVKVPYWITMEVTVCLPDEAFDGLSTEDYIEKIRDAYGDESFEHPAIRKAVRVVDEYCRFTFKNLKDPSEANDTLLPADPEFPGRAIVLEIYDYDILEDDGCEVAEQV